jgi:hypothetical protein
MTNTPFTDSTDTLGVVCTAIGVVTSSLAFYALGGFCFILSFGVRLGNERRIEQYLKSIQERAKK